jgi:hypothetical protein
MLGMMTSLIVTSQSKERTSVLLPREAIFNQSAARSPVQHTASSEFSPSEKISQGKSDSSRIIIGQFIGCP